MANATRDIKTERKASNLYRPKEVANAIGGRVYYTGTMQVIDANGRADNPGGGNIALRVVGIVWDHTDNSAGANDERKVELETGEVKMKKHATNPPTWADRGKMVFASDNQTISRSAADGSPAGVLTEVEVDGVMVDISPAAVGAPNAAA